MQNNSQLERRKLSVNSFINRDLTISEVIMTNSRVDVQEVVFITLISESNTLHEKGNIWFSMNDCIN